MALVIIAQISFSWVGLDASSYWLDEIYTARFIDNGTVLDTLVRSAGDVHPPLYYVIAHLWGDVFGFSEVAIRALSALCCGGAALLLILLPHRAISLPGRIFAAAVAVSSLFWFEHSQNARSYGLLMLLAAAMTGIGLSLLTDGDGPARSLRVRLAWLGAAGLATAGTHAYGFLFVGLVYAYLFLFGGARLRWLVLPVGLATAIVMIAVYLWLVRNASIPVGATWFSNAPAFLATQTAAGIRSWFGKPALAALAILAVAALPGWSSLPRSIRPIASGAGFLLWLVIGLLVAGIGSSLAVAPNFSGRNWGIAAPAVWLAFGYAFDLLWPRVSPRLQPVLGLLVALPLLLQLAAVRHRLEPWREEFRGSANFIKNEADCANKPIPVITGEQGAPLYGYYLQGSPYRVAALPYRDGALMASPELAKVIRSREDGSDRCPVVGWLAHSMGMDPKIIGRELARMSRSGAAVTVQAIEHRQLDNGFRPTADAFVFVASPVRP